MTKMIVLGKERTTVTIYSQNFIPVQAKSGFARSTKCQRAGIVSLYLTYEVAQCYIELLELL